MTYTPAHHRIIDALVAEHVMGVQYRQTYPSYSTDIAAAWKVVLYMESKGWRFSRENFGNRTRFNFSDAPEFAGTPEWTWMNNVEHTDDCVGICLAALRAKGIDVDAALAGAQQ